MLRHYKEAFIRLFYPADCAICHQMLTLEEKILCTNCAQNLNDLVWPLEEAWVEERFESLDHVWAVYAYRSPLKELLHGVKYARKDHLLRVCRGPALSLAQAVTSDHGYHAILPIPIHRLKLVKRHFNQAEVLADLLGPGVTPPIARSFLIKKYPIPSQTFLNQEERAINVYGAFKVRDAQKIADRSFLLIDDVFTTGATANEAARTLKSHGARRVDLLALARTVQGPTEKQFEIHPSHG